MQSIETEFTVEAAIEDVWQVLMDHASYPDWNPFITRIEGPVSPGERLVVDLVLEGRRPQTVRPTVLEAAGPHQLAWRGSLGLRGIFDGTHSWELIDCGNGSTRVLHSESFSGVLVRPILALVGAKTQAGFVAMNRAMKARVEALVADRSA